MEISNDILELIKKELPNKHAEAMAEFIKDAQDNKKALEEFKKNYEKLNEAFIKVNIENVDFRNKVSLAKDILAAEERVKREVRDLELDRLKFDITKEMDALKVNEATKRADSLYTIVALLSRNPEAIKMFTENSGHTYQTYYDGNRSMRERNASFTTGNEETKVTKKDPPPAGQLDIN